MEYGQKFRDQMVRKMLAPSKATATALSKESGVSQSTLSKWLRQARTRSADCVLAARVATRYLMVDETPLRVAAEPVKA
jgi:transposase-like protein